MTDANPSIDPANEGSMIGMMRQVFRKFMQQTDDMLPARVVAFDREQNRAQVVPMVMMIDTEGKTISRAPVASIPVFQIGGGGFILNFNLRPNDLGWIKANDRDISLFLQSAKESGPNTYRMKTFEDAIFFPDPIHGYTINDEDEENCVLQTLDGSQRVAIWSDKIKITSNTEIVLDAPLTTITGELQANTNGSYTQAASFGGIVTVVEDVIAGPNTVSLVTHVHQNAGGTGNSGIPV